MLPDRYLQLLTAFVDGEISARERKHVTRLLRKSPAARTVLQRLQEDSHGIRDLTRLKLGPDFPAKVLRTLGQSGIRPTRTLRPAPTVPAWVGVTVAASVLVLIGAASYWYFAPRQGARVEGPFVVNLQPDPLAANVLVGAFGRFGQTAIRLAAGELAAETTRTRLAQELRQQKTYHVDVAVQDNSRAVENLAAALRHSGFQVLMGAGTQKGLTQKQAGTSYLLFAENLLPEELAGILQQLGSRLQPEAKGTFPDAGVRQVIVDVMTLEDRQRLAKLLGVPGEGLQSSDPPADLINRTIIAGNAKGQGGSAIAPKAAAPALPDRFALVFALPEGAVSGPAESPELRTYLSGRRGHRPGTLQVLLVVHQANV